MPPRFPTLFFLKVEGVPISVVTGFFQFGVKSASPNIIKYLLTKSLGSIEKCRDFEIVFSQLEMQSLCRGGFFSVCYDLRILLTLMMFFVPLTQLTQNSEGIQSEQHSIFG